MLRINYDNLDEDRDGACWWEGKPFTGIAFELYENGQLASEMEFVNGIENGDRRLWYPSGRLELEATGRFDDPFRRVTEWFENGNLKREVVVGYDGRRLKEKVWNEQGELVSEYSAPSHE